MISIRRLSIIALSLLAGATSAGEPAQNAALEQLLQSNVSRLEWGLDKLKRALTETFAVDPLSLEPSVPPFFINVGYKQVEGRIMIEVGRTFPSLDDAQAHTYCDAYIARIRGFLSVDKLGRPAIKGASALAEEFFHPLGAAAPPTEAFAQALDRAVTLRGLVASPLNGVYAICTANLTEIPVPNND